ncbi:hypothetical protein FOS14_18345 [Skermania sp. ID1734]|uniref:hypothetical protein n=1 Tax=Skermania sp. ID1734 TaxID=2597516 RepID=UPI00117D416E|nr:hypothetical protein [Skermania sp. ID1734]TSD95321.1 hypothetical protein FOS14_18345 [Skermania sp. ID1734]
MRVTSSTRLASELRLQPSAQSALRQLSLEDIAKLNELIEAARVRHRSEMRSAIIESVKFLPIGKLYDFATRGRR